MPHMLGRKPRARSPLIAHMSALTAGRFLPPPPPAVDWLGGLPDDLGMMLNDSLGDCTCAAVYHAIQVWTANAGLVMQTEPDIDVLTLYERACGYNPADPSTDQGGDEQHVLRYWLRQGAPMTGNGVNKLAAFVEIDPRITDDVKRAIAACGLVYIGFNVPAYLMASEPPAVWDVDENADNTIIGGHAVILPSYTATQLGVVSWAKKYAMTWAFFARFVDEVYGLADDDWINAKGTTPGGLTKAQLEAQMRVLR